MSEDNDHSGRLSTGSTDLGSGQAESQAQANAATGQVHNPLNDPAGNAENPAADPHGAYASAPGPQGAAVPESDAERTQHIPAVQDDSTTVGEVAPVEPAEPSPAATQSFPAATQGFTAAPAGAEQTHPNAYAAPQTAATQTAITPPITGQAAGFGGGTQTFEQPPYEPFHPAGTGYAAGGATGPASGSRFGRLGDFWTSRSSRFRAGLIGAVAAAVLVLAYVVDLVASSGEVPRGTVVAGVSIGSMEPAAAERKLRTELADEISKAIQLRVVDQQAAINPRAAGLSVDWEATINKAGSQPLNPLTRLRSFFTTREITPVSNVDRSKLNAQLQEVKPKLHTEPVEGTIRFDGAKPVAVMPVTGRTLDIEQAANVVIAKWVNPQPVQLPFTTESVSTTREGVRKALNQVAKPAVSAPVIIKGDGVTAKLTPEEIANSLRFEPDGNGGLKWHVDTKTAKAATKPGLKSTIKKGRNAKIIIQGGKPVVQPSVNGRGVNWKKTFASLREVLVQPGKSTVGAVYEDQPAKFTTEEAKALGIKEKVSTFTTTGFSHDSGVNIRRVAQEVDGAIVKPGETFSLNGYTGIRQKPQGYIASGIIKNGRPAKAVGGGISQFATTLYNASYFAGLKDIEHHEHSYYISRYPIGREATVFQQKDGTSILDVKFKNIMDTGILIDTKWTPNSITVTFWGTEQFKVKSEHSDKSDFTDPETITVPADEPCIPTDGQKGFTVYNTRIRTNIETGEVTKARDKTVYEPQPIVKCAKK